MTLDIPSVRPAVLATGSAAHLERFLSFRHRFRNLYVFDLDGAQLRPLLETVPPAWAMVRGGCRFGRWSRAPGPSAQNLRAQVGTLSPLFPHP